MKKILTVAWLAFMTAFPAHANVLVITDVPVDAIGENTVAARENAMTAGQTEAFNRLIGQMVAPEHVAQIVPATPEQLMDMVRDVSVSNEKTTATRYMGTLSVRFKTAAVQSFLKAQDIPFQAALPTPLLMIPVYRNGDVLLGLDDANPFFAALKQSVPTGQVYQFRIPAGDEAETAAVASVLAGGDVSVLHPLAQKYGVSRILFVSVTQADTLYRVETYVYPEARVPEAGVVFSLTDDRTKPVTVAQDVLNDLVRYLDKTWMKKQESRDAKKEKIEAIIPLNSVTEMGRLQKELKRIRGVENATVKGIQNKQLLVELTFVGDAATLPERITGPFTLTRDGNTYILNEKGAQHAENQ